MRRKRCAFRPGTIRNHACMIRKYVAFCVRYGLKHINPDEITVCAYIEHLATQFKSHKSVSNYISAIRLMHKFIHEPCPALDSFEGTLMLRATRITMRNIPFQRPPVTVHMLRELCKLCDGYKETGIVIRCALLFGFFGLLRSSNICPPSRIKFDTTRHLRRRDVHINSKGLVVRIKWTKTLQQAGQPRVVPIPRINDPLIDPVATFITMKNKFPCAPDAPLFSFVNGIILTQNRFKAVFQELVNKAGLGALGLTPHSLRRGGCSACYEKGATELDIQRQGVWSGTCFKNYVMRSDPHQSTACLALIQAAAQL